MYCCGGGLYGCAYCGAPTLLLLLLLVTTMFAPPMCLALHACVIVPMWQQSTMAPIKQKPPVNAKRIPQQQSSTWDLKVAAVHAAHAAKPHEAARRARIFHAHDL